MATELKRGAIRVLSNYARLFLLLVMGILLVPIFISGIGDEAFGLFGLLGSTLGLAEMCKTIMRESMNRELGEAYHSEDPEAFTETYNSALVLSSALAGLTALLFAILWFAVPLLTIPDHLIGAARWYVATHGTLSTAIVLLGPTYNMYLVSERLVLFNTWMTLHRATDLMVAIVLFLIIGISDPANGLKAFAVFSALTSMVILVFAVGLMMRLDRRVIPDLSRIRRARLKKIMPTAGWNGVAVTAMNLHIRIDQLIMNIFFGVAAGNAVFTLAVRLSSYVRLIARGGTDGLDVVSARLSTAMSSVSIAQLMREATRMHAVVALPACMIVLIAGKPLMDLWVGRHLQDPAIVGQAVTLASILVIGMTIRGISDSWARILYGCGHIRRYAPLVVIGGACNPVLAVALILALPESIAFTGPAISFTAIFIVVHLFMIPGVASKWLEIPLMEIITPLGKPIAATALGSIVLWVPRMIGAEDSPIVVLVCIAGFGAVHAALCWFYVLNDGERIRLQGGIRRRLKLTPPAPPS